MAEFINTADVIGDDEMCDQIIMRTVTEYKENRITTVGQCAFYGCTELAVVDVPSVTTVAANALNGCSVLTALILRGETVCTLANANALSGTPIASGTGYIYIPAALKDSYAAATNWSTYAAQFRALEDFTVDGTVTGELDETKIAA
jgi:hypothetical protein